MLDEHAELILRDRFSSLLHIDGYHQPIRNCWLGLLSGGCNRAPKTKRCCGKQCNPYPQSSPSCLSPSCRFFAVTPCPDRSIRDKMPYRGRRLSLRALTNRELIDVNADRRNRDRALSIVQQNLLYLGMRRPTDMISGLQATPRRLKAWECIMSGLSVIQAQSEDR